ncbi:hypothetical protein NX059_000844 [Plenodomus lindquistii]|nr:hypothetical protein NX059_000844 [Plenodomus lindquistii]
MARMFIALLACVATTHAQSLLDLPLDIATLLSSLGPAPPTDPRFTTFTPPGPNDVRSACPALNTLSNHAFIPPSGRNLTLPLLIRGFSSALNTGADFTTLIGSLGLLTSSNPLSGTFDLDEISQHNFPIEHDASLSRLDAAFGDFVSFNAETWSQFIGFFEGKGVTNLRTVAQAKYDRFNHSLTHNPEFVYGVREQVLSYGENALFLQSLGEDTVSGVAKLDYVKMFFEQERLPWELGWRPSRVPVTLGSLGGMIVRLGAESPGPEVEGERVGRDTYKDLLIGLAGGSKALAALSGGISEALGL